MCLAAGRSSAARGGVTSPAPHRQRGKATAASRSRAPHWAPSEAAVSCPEAMPAVVEALKARPSSMLLLSEVVVAGCTTAG